jgi:hypothetical protein
LKAPLCHRHRECKRLDHGALTLLETGIIENAASERELGAMASRLCD